MSNVDMSNLAYLILRTQDVSREAAQTHREATFQLGLAVSELKNANDALARSLELSNDRLELAKQTISVTGDAAGLVDSEGAENLGTFCEEAGLVADERTRELETDLSASKERGKGIATLEQAAERELDRSYEQRRRDFDLLSRILGQQLDHA